MSASIIAHPRRGSRRIPLDRELEVTATAGYFAAAINAGIITPTIKAQAENYIRYGTPVRQYLGGVPLEEENAS